MEIIWKNLHAPHQPGCSALLDFDQTMFLLDSSFLATTSIIDWDQIDVILISCYKDATALPYITEYTKFKGTILSTLPTIQFAQLAMKEELHYATQWNIDHHESHINFPYVYSDIEACIEKIEMVYFNDIKVNFIFDSM
jgi:integrator complex subunit 9